MIINNYQAQEVAEILLNINAVKLQPSNFFTWSSGKKSPIYCDNRVILSYPNEREKIKNIFASYIKEKIENVNCIAGVATGAIAHGMMVASALNLPFVYVREQAKKHGRQNQIEGKLDSESKIIVIEDLISTGKSSMNAIKAIEYSEAKVIGLISIFTYSFFNISNLSIPCVSLCDYKTLIEVALSKNIIRKEEIAILEDWHAKFKL